MASYTNTPVSNQMIRTEMTAPTTSVIVGWEGRRGTGRHRTIYNVHTPIQLHNDMYHRTQQGGGGATDICTVQHVHVNRHTCTYMYMRTCMYMYMHVRVHVHVNSTTCRHSGSTYCRQCTYTHVCGRGYICGVHKKWTKEVLVHCTLHVGTFVHACTCTCTCTNVIFHACHNVTRNVIHNVDAGKTWLKKDLKKEAVVAAITVLAHYSWCSTCSFRD